MITLYNNLKSLCDVEDSSFYFKDFSEDDTTYRIFNYRLASYTDFLKPDALEARGIMFEMKGEEPLRIASRPMQKFFNLNENPFTMDLDHSKAWEFMEKADGSLISTYLHNGQLKLKTKGSISSEQSVMATNFLKLPENKNFLLELFDVAHNGYTVNMEFVSPNNRIVLPYQKDELKVLNIRNNETGITLYHDDMYGDADEHFSWIESKAILDPERFIARIPGFVDIEGYVIRYENGKLVKIKTEWYLALHHTKDSIIIPRRLFECVVNEATDDLRSMFATDQWALDTIKAMEDMVVPKINHMISSVEKYYEENKELDRKGYAIKGQKELGPYFNLGMTKYLAAKGLYTGGENYKAFAIKNYKMFGVPDVEENNAE